MATIEARNAYYKGTLAARRAKALSNAPESLNAECLAMWIAGFNEEMVRVKAKEEENAMLASML